MAGKWCMDNVTALIVAGVRFTLQAFEYRFSTTSQSTNTVYLWMKDSNQGGPGFKIEAPLLFTDCKWAHWDAFTTAGPTDYNEATFYEGSFGHFGTAGYPAGTPYATPTETATVLMPHTSRDPLSNLAFDPLGVRAAKADGTTNTPNISLFINGQRQYIMTPGYIADPDQYGNYREYWMGYALGQPNAPI